jgi:hypothetical protein
MTTFTVAEQTERRRAVRRQPAIGTEFHCTYSGNQAPGVGLVWNISTSGLSMLVRESHHRGDLIRGELVTINGQDSLSTSLQVTHSRNIETGDYFLGAQFERSLTETELRPFITI